LFSLDRIAHDALDSHRLCGSHHRVHTSAWADSRKVLKIAITAGGQISADGRPTTLDALVPMLRELAKNKGEVWYYREAPEVDPHPNAMKVLEAIVDQGLPILFSTKPDYSDSVDDKGRSVPRK
jgi:biopolymer transport protein ExbD